MRVGLVTASISRNAGGLFESVRGLAFALNGIEDTQVHLFGVEDANTPNDMPLWKGIPAEAHGVIGPEAWSFAPSLAKAVFDADLDLLHSHGAWMYPSLVGLRWKRRTGKCHLITPQGMLDPWAVRRSGWKKVVAGQLYENAYLRAAACLHAVCEEEAKAFRAYGLQNPVVVIPNGVDMCAFDAPTGSAEWARTLPDCGRVLLYLGRLHPKKGLENLVHAWRLAKDRGNAKADAWCLVIAGHGDSAFEARLRQLVSDEGVVDSVYFVGAQYGRRKIQSYQQADALILPSFSEGQPMAVLEAWASGLPVLMTPQCNLSEGFIRESAIRIEANASGIAQGIMALFEMSQEERRTCGRRGKQLVAQRFQWSRIGCEMKKAYDWVLGSGAKPECLFTG